MHRYRTPGEPDGRVLPIGSTVDCQNAVETQNDEGPHATEIYEKNRGWTAVEERYIKVNKSRLKFCA